MAVAAVTAAYVIHAPWPYSHRSAGVRALYILAGQLQQAGRRVAISPLPSPWQPEEPPIELSLTSTWPETVVRDAVHVYPDIVKGNPAGADRVVRWQLGRKRFPAEPGDVEFAWAPEVCPRPAHRLVVDVIEPELFFEKSSPGSGTLWWFGKERGAIPTLGIRRFTRGWRWRLMMNVGRFRGTRITQTWPATRRELAIALRAADVLVSLDSFSALNGEATLCGTPVLLVGDAARQPPPDTIFGERGVVRSPKHLDRARAEIPEAIAHYEALRSEISGDVENFMKICEQHFGEI